VLSGTELSIEKGPKKHKGSYQTLWRSSIGRLQIGVFGMRPRTYFCHALYGSLINSSYIISSCVCEDIVQCVSLGDVLRSLAHDDDKFDFIVRYMFLCWLSYLGNDYRGQGSDEGRQGFIKKNWEANYVG
jgi:hypothetical protein